MLPEAPKYSLGFITTLQTPRKLTKYMINLVLVRITRRSCSFNTRKLSVHYKISHSFAHAGTVAQRQLALGAEHARCRTTHSAQTFFWPIST